MATPVQIMTRLDGLLGSGLRTGGSPASYQRAITWKHCLRLIMFQDVLRNQTDWNLTADIDVIDTGTNSVIAASGGTVYGVLVDHIYDETDFPVIVIADIAAQTLAAETSGDWGSGALGTELEEVIAMKLPVASAATAPQLHGYLYPNGVVFATTIEAMANDAQGADMVANDVRLHVVYRTSTSRA